MAEVGSFFPWNCLHYDAARLAFLKAGTIMIDSLSIVSCSFFLQNNGESTKSDSESYLEAFIPVMRANKGLLYIGTVRKPTYSLKE